jgi:hypothetical protein
MDASFICTFLSTILAIMVENWAKNTCAFHFFTKKWVLSSVVEQATADRLVTSSNLVGPVFIYFLSQVYQMAQRIRDGLYIVKKKEAPPKHFDLWAEKPKPVVNEWLPDYLQPKPEYHPKGRVIAPKQKLPGKTLHSLPP